MKRKTVTVAALREALKTSLHVTQRSTGAFREVDDVWENISCTVSKKTLLQDACTQNYTA
jgi:hypothetical protein